MRFALVLVAFCAAGGLARSAAPDLTLPPGVAIAHVPASTGVYLGSPAIAVLPGGDYVASHDLFGPQCEQHLTRVFRSKDRGQTWERLTEVSGQYWSSLFVHRGALYLLGTAAPYGNCVIRRSEDGGATWTEPKDEHTGLLLEGPVYHCAPVPVLRHAGRLWRGMEDKHGPGGWGKHFRAFMMSVPGEANLLEAKNWTSSNRLAGDMSWLDGRFGGWLEGNAVATPEGGVVDILRVHDMPEGGTAAIAEISEDGATATFDPETGFIDFPGGAKKFTIRHDPQTDLYWTLVNYVFPGDACGNAERTRNTLALAASPGLRHWEVRAVVLRHPDVKHVGFQYVDWLFEGDDLIAVSRTAHPDGLGGAHNCHDANFMTFHRIADFRDLRHEVPKEPADNPVTAEEAKAWARPYRGWHYYPDHVVPPSPDDGLGFKSVDCPLVFRHGDEWRMFYTGYDGNGYRTAMARSDGLVHWTPTGQVMGYGAPGAYDHGGVAFCGVLYDSYDVKGARTLDTWQGRHWALYSCYPRQGGYELRPGAEGAAWSEDGDTWHRLSATEPTLSIEGASWWEKDCIYAPWLLQHGGRFWDFYNAANGSIEQMGIATSTDMKHWTRYAGNPVLRNGPAGSYDEKFCSDGKVYRDGDHWVMLYFGVGRGGAHIMAAFSRDLYHWTKDPAPLYKAGGHPGGLDSKYAHKISLVYDEDRECFFMFYCAVGDAGRGIGLITSKPLE